MQTPANKVSGGIRAIGPVPSAPEVKMLDWRVFEVQQADRADRTRHFVGSTGWHYDGQVSSAIVRYDPATRCGTSESGRVYQLVGPGSGIGMNASYVWNVWQSKAGVRDVLDVTPEVEALICPWSVAGMNGA